MKVAINEDLPEINIVLDYMFEVAESSKLSASNKFSFDSNDYKKGHKSPIKLMSNHMWKQDRGIVFESKLFSFYILKENNTITVYAHDTKNEIAGIDALIKKVNEDHKQIEKSLVLKAEGNRCLSVNQNFIVAFSNDLKLIKAALIDKGYGEPKYPVDIYSYEYQLSYWQKKTRIPEFDFVNNVLHGGLMSEYDPSTGRFFVKNTKYDPSVIGFKLKEKDQKEKVTIVETKKVDFEYLDKDWHNALGKVLQVLKRDRPQYGEKEANLDKLIKFYENKLTSKSYQPSLNFSRKF